MKEPIGRRGSFNPGTGPADRFRQLCQRFILADDLRPKHGIHLQKLLRFGFGDLIDRNAGHHRDNVGDALFTHLVDRVLRLQFPFAFGDLQIAQ